MAKGNPLLGQMRGSIGDVVFWRGNGQQLSRSRNRQPANPRSNSQLTTRILLKTASTAYSKLMYDYANQTFQGSKIGAENQRRFMSANIKILRDYIDQGSDDLNFMGKDDTAAMLNRYRVSEGNLPSINATVANPASGSTTVTIGPLFSPAAEVPTYQEICDAFGVAPGTQLSFLLCHVELGTIAYVQRKRIILAPASGDMSLPFYVGAEINDPNPANDALGLLPNFSANQLHFEAFGDFYAAAVVASFYDGTKWQYSTEQIWYNPLGGYGIHTLAQAIESWKTAIAGSDEYTRQSNVPESAGGAFIESRQVTVTFYDSEGTQVGSHIYQDDECDSISDSHPGGSVSSTRVRVDVYGRGLAALEVVDLNVPAESTASGSATHRTLVINPDLADWPVGANAEFSVLCGEESVAFCEIERMD